jgi:peptidyl-prolyl cis-trans isomerase A (cyclophilin A)
MIAIMNRRFVLAALPLLFALTAAAPAKKHAAPTPSPPPLGDTVRVAMVTDLGTIELDLDHKHAPVTVENFMHYVDTGRFSGLAFYRAMRVSFDGQPNGLIQAGLQGRRPSYPGIAHEPTNVTGIHHVAGTISMARFAPGTAASDFSIMATDMLGLDADPTSSNPEVQAGFAAFGHVVSGMDVVRRIWDGPISPTKGDGAMKGQILEPAIKVLSVKRVPLPEPSPVPAAPAPAAG